MHVMSGRVVMDGAFSSHVDPGEPTIITDLLFGAAQAGSQALRYLATEHYLSIREPSHRTVA